MTPATVDLRSWILLYIVEGGGTYRIDAAHWDEIDAAFGDWVDRRRDRVLALSGWDGTDIRVAASRISDFCLTHPADRERNRQLLEALKAEDGFTE